MTINITATAGKAALDHANANQIPDVLRALAFGHFVRAMPTPRRAVNPGALASNPYVAAAAQCLTLPDDAKALYLFRAYARVGAGTVGALTVDAPDSYSANGNPNAGHCVVGPTGDILFHGADLWTSVDLLYLPEKYDVLETTLPVASNLLALPSPSTNGEALILLEAQATVGTSTGSKIVDPPGTAVAAGHAAFDAAKANVAFNSGDAVTSARVKYAVMAAVDIDAFLETASSVFF